MYSYSGIGSIERTLDFAIESSYTRCTCWIDSLLRLSKHIRQWCTSLIKHLFNDHDIVSGNLMGRKMWKYYLGNVFLIFELLISQELSCDFINNAFQDICDMLITDIYLFAEKRFINCKISNFAIYKSQDTLLCDL